MNAPLRHYDIGKGLGAFADRIEVSCPRCARPGTVRAQWADRYWRAAFGCGGCGLEQRSDGHHWMGKVETEGRDPHLGLPLRLIKPTRAGLLWAYNIEHIEELRRYVAADHRERRCAMSNKTMASRLPTWMKLARHRRDVLKALDRLRELGQQRTHA